MRFTDRLFAGPSIVRSRWQRWSARPSRVGGPRLLLIGNCQASAISTAMRLLRPDADVVFTSAFGIDRTYPRMEDLVRAGAAFDFVFANAFAAPFRDGGTFETLRAGVNLVPIPTVVFSAFHPDAIYVGDRIGGGDGRDIVYGPMGGYHSALALHGYLEGFTLDETERLFGRETFSRLGYLDVWPDAEAALLKLGRDAGYPLDDEIVRWARRGSFMHGINHPKVFVANDLARGLLAKAGIAHGECDLDSYVADPFIAAGTWPIYPDIAAYYGVAGSSLFLKAPSRRTGPTRTMTLRAFLKASFASYARRPRARLVSPRTETWRESDAIRSDLRMLSGR